MPELPEVEIFKRYFDETSLHQKIKGVQILHPKVVESPQLDEVLTGDAFESSRRWGKNLFVLTNKGKTANMHFGMTGHLEYYHHSVETPKYTRVVFQFENDYNLGYISKRMFGRLGLVAGVDQYIADKSLAVDALEIDLEGFTENVQKRKKNIKAVLLDQGTAAGVGNWIADEILYQSRIHPSSPSQSLNPQQISTIYGHMQGIIQTAIDTDSVREQLPDHYITRYGRKTTISCPNCQNDIEKTVVAGRGTYACSHCQSVLTS